MTSIYMYVKIDSSQYLNADKKVPTIWSEMTLMLRVHATSMRNENNFKHIHGNVAKKELSSNKI